MHHFRLNKQEKIKVKKSRSRYRVLAEKKNEIRIVMMVSNF